MFISNFLFLELILTSSIGNGVKENLRRTVSCPAVLVPGSSNCNTILFQRKQALGDEAWREEVPWQVVRVQSRYAPRDVPQGVLLGGLRSKSG